MTASSQHWPSQAPDYASLAIAAQAEAARWNVPGLTAALLHDGERSATATGLTNLDYPAPVTVDTGFQVGSITKVFTATAIMALVEQGKLDLGAPVTTWVPEVPLGRKAGLETLTIRHLLNHTTGFEGDVFFDTGSGDDALAEGIRRFGKIRQWTIPGEIFAYCNTGFYLAGRIIEIVTGQPYEDAVAELIITPLGLEHTRFPSLDLVTRPTASGHTMKDRATGHSVYRPWALPRVVNAAGGIVSTVDDLLTFAEMHLNGGIHGETRLISVASATSMRDRTSRSGNLDTGFGIGWNIKQIDGATVASHNGGTNGFRALLATVPARGFTLAVLTNGDLGGKAMEEIQAWALRHYLDIDTPQRLVIDAGTDVLDAVTGRYERHDAIIDVWRVDDHLHVERRVVEHEDQFSTERREGDPPTVFQAWPTGEGVFRVLEGPFKDSLIEFFDGKIFGNDGDELVTRQLSRSGSRLSKRTGDAPASGPTVIE